MVVDWYDAMACACFSHFVERARATSTASSRVLLSRTNGWSNMQPATSTLHPARPCACRHMAGSHASFLPGAGLFITRRCPSTMGACLGDAPGKHDGLAGCELNALQQQRQQPIGVGSARRLSLALERPTPCS